MKLHRTLALLITFLMALQMMPVSAFAEDNDTSAALAAVQEYSIASQEQSGSSYYAVTFQFSDRNSQTQLVRAGTTISLPAAAAEDSTVRFDGWYTAEGFQAGTEGVSFTPLSDVVLTARYTTTNLTKSITSESNLGHLVLTAPTGFLGLGQGGLPSGSEAEANWADISSAEGAALAAVPVGEGMTNRAIGAFMLSLSSEYWQQNSNVHANISFNRSFDLKENETLTLVRVSGGPQIIRCTFSGNPLSGADFTDDALGTYVIVGTSPVAEEEAEPDNYTYAETDLTLRAAPAGTAEVLANVPAGTKIIILSEEGEWMHLRLKDGTEGYAYQNIASDESEMSVTIFTNRRAIMEVGEPITLTSKIRGFDGYEVYYVWSVDKGNGFEEIPDSNAPTYTYEASVESLSWDWAVEVYYR